MKDIDKNVNFYFLHICSFAIKFGKIAYMEKSKQVNMGIRKPRNFD
jgi:hypothetical protein